MRAAFFARAGLDAQFAANLRGHRVPINSLKNAMSPANAHQVLYVEDDRLNIVLMEEVFRRLPDWTLICAEDGAQALGLLDDIRPDLVLIDMNLPDMSGLALLAGLRSKPAGGDLYCVALSADDFPDQVEAALAAGFRDYWVKPIDVIQMAEDLRGLLRVPGR